MIVSHMTRVRNRLKFEGMVHTNIKNQTRKTVVHLRITNEELSPFIESLLCLNF